MSGKYETSKNALSEIYCNLTLQVLSDEFTNYVLKFDAVSDLTAEIQKAIRSNKLKGEEDKKNFEKAIDDIFVFEEKKSNLKETENEIVQNIINDRNFPLQKAENDYTEPKPQTVIEIED